MSNIRDFIYYDKSKVLSIGSQLLEGIAETIQIEDKESQEKKNSTDIKTAAMAHAGLNTDSSFFLTNLVGKLGSVDANLSGDIAKTIEKNLLSENNKFENKVMEHYQFTLLRKALIEQDMLKDLDKIKSHEWDNRKAVEKIKPGDFFELTCRSRIYDIKHLEGMAIGIEAIFNLLQQMAIAEDIKSEPSKLSEVLETINNSPTDYGYALMNKTLGGSISPVEFNAIIELMKNISNTGLSSVPTQLISRPKSGPKNGLKFVSPLRNQYLIDTREELIFKYGYEPEQDWKMLGQICEIPKEKKNEEIGFENIDFGKDSKLDDVFQNITDVLMGVSSSIGMSSVVKYPNISVNLIAVYR